MDPFIPYILIAFFTTIIALVAIVYRQKEVAMDATNSLSGELPPAEKSDK